MISIEFSYRNLSCFLPRWLSCYVCLAHYSRDASILFSAMHLQYVMRKQICIRWKSILITESWVVFVLCVFGFVCLFLIGNSWKVNNAFGGRTFCGRPNLYRRFPVDVSNLSVQPNGSGQEVVGVVQWPQPQG